MGKTVKSGSLRRLGIAVVVMVAVLAIATRLPPGPGLLVLALGVAFLGFAAWKWGHDSRVGGNWKRR
jgi:hypothetical protein